MLYVDYEQFMQDMQSETNIKLPEHNRFSGYYDEKNFISCNRKSDDLVLFEASLRHNENYSKNEVSLKIPFEIINKKIVLNYPIDNVQIMDGIARTNEYLPVYHSVEIAGKSKTDLFEDYYTSNLLISADLVITTDIHRNVSYILDDIHFDFQIQYRLYGGYKVMSIQNIFKHVDDKLKSKFYTNNQHYEQLSMNERVWLYNIANKLSANF